MLALSEKATTDLLSAIGAVQGETTQLVALCDTVFDNTIENDLAPTHAAFRAAQVAIKDALPGIDDIAAEGGDTDDRDEKVNRELQPLILCRDELRTELVTQINTVLERDKDCHAAEFALAQSVQQASDVLRQSEPLSVEMEGIEGMSSVLDCRDMTGVVSLFIEATSELELLGLTAFVDASLDGVGLPALQSGAGLVAAAAELTNIATRVRSTRISAGVYLSLLLAGAQAGLEKKNRCREKLRDDVRILESVTPAFDALASAFESKRAEWDKLDQELIRITRARRQRSMGSSRRPFAQSTEVSQLRKELYELDGEIGELGCQLAQMIAEHLPEQRLNFPLGLAPLLVDIDDVEHRLFHLHIKLNHFEIVKTLKGRLDVLLARTPDGRELVLKAYQFQRLTRERRRFRRVVRTLNRVAHPNIQRLEQVFVEDDERGIDVAYAVFEFYPCGDAADWIGGSSRPDSADVRSMLIQVLSAIAHIHGLEVVHGDVKLDNVFLRAISLDVQAMLGDFDLCFDRTAATVPTNKTGGGGSLHYIPPVLETLGTTHADLFAFGVCVLKAVSCNLDARVEYDGTDTDAVLPSNVEDETSELLGVLLAREAERRGTAGDALQLRFFDTVRDKQHALEAKHAALRGEMQAKLFEDLQKQRKAFHDLEEENARLFMQMEAQFRNGCVMSVPDYWSSPDRLHTDHELALVDVGNDVYLGVQRLFDELLKKEYIGKGKDGNGMQHTRLHVIRVQRNENRTLYDRFVRCKQSVSSTNAPCSRSSSMAVVLTGQLSDPDARRWIESLHLDSSHNEVLLMHGTPRDGAVRWRQQQNSSSKRWSPHSEVKYNAVQAILKHGFDPRVANSGMLGYGVYCAERPCKADRYALRYSDDPTSSSRGEVAQMFLCRVALGRVFVTQERMTGLRRPPCIEGHVDQKLRCDHLRCDSVVFAGSHKYREFVLFDKDQVFPEFLVEYTRL
eukprot:TRINITY_DN10163_c0_g2_i1.p1 TRINITY_DN10163_c0_g2~~TRINITY_DN10163_c0_g2_i1.p1  ORF type:complete len:1003 (+),score=153.01 TRINITY_DN10163_c0_g2_i1:123-3011(+)